MSNSGLQRTLLAGVLVSAAIAAYFLLSDLHGNEATSNCAQPSAADDSQERFASLRGTPNTKKITNPTNAESSSEPDKAIAWPPWKLELLVWHSQRAPHVDTEITLRLRKEKQTIQEWNARTDDQGIARFKNIDIGKYVETGGLGYEFVATLPGTLPSQYDRKLWNVPGLRALLRDLAYANPESTITLRENVATFGHAQRSVRITTSQGVPLSGVCLSAFQPELDYRMGLSPPKTDPSGRAHFRVPDDWKGELRLLMADSFDLNKRMNIARVGEQAIALSPSLVGRVVDSQGQGVSGVPVDIRLVSAPNYPSDTIAWPKVPMTIDGVDVFAAESTIELVRSFHPDLVRWSVRTIRAISNDDGEIAFVGLKPNEPYEVFVIEPGGANRQVSKSIRAGESLRIEVNRSDVTWRLIDAVTGAAVHSSCWVQRVWRAPDPLLRIRDDASDIARIEMNMGPYEVKLPMGSVWVVRARAKGYLPKDVLFTVPDKVQATAAIALTPRNKTKPVCVRCQTADGETLRDLPLTVTQEGRGPQVFDIQWHGDVAHVQYLEAEEAQFRANLGKYEQSEAEPYRYLLPPKWPVTSKDVIAKGQVDLKFQVGGRAIMRLKIAGTTEDAPDASIHITPQPSTETHADATSSLTHTAAERSIPLARLYQISKQGSGPAEYAFETPPLAPGTYDVTFRYPERNAAVITSKRPVPLSEHTTVEIVKGKDTPVLMSITLPEHR